MKLHRESTIRETVTFTESDVGRIVIKRRKREEESEIMPSLEHKADISEQNEGEWTGKVEKRTKRKSKLLAVGEACLAIF